MIDIKDSSRETRKAVRDGLTDKWGAVTNQKKDLPLDEVQSVLEITITALDALERVESLAAELMEAEGGAGLVARAFAEEIRRAIADTRKKQ